MKMETKTITGKKGSSYIFGAKDQYSLTFHFFICLAVTFDHFWVVLFSFYRLSSSVSSHICFFPFQIYHFSFLEATITSCANIPDGDYAFGCNPNYVSCINGKKINRKCSKGSVYSNKVHRCVTLQKCLSMQKLFMKQSSERLRTGRNLNSINDFPSSGYCIKTHLMLRDQRTFLRLKKKNCDRLIFGT